MMNLLYFFMTITGILPELIYFKRKTYYENKKSQGRNIKGRAIIVSNHISIKDYMVMMFVFFFRKIRCLVASVVYEKKAILRGLLKICGAVKVDRESYNMSFIQESINLLEKNRVLLVFPEARLAKNKDVMSNFAPTYILMALKTKSPILPIYNDGNYGFKKRVHVMIGEKIYLNDYVDGENATKEQIEYLNNIVMSKIKELKNKMLKKIEEEKQKRYTFKKFLWDFGRIHLALFVRLKGIKINYKGIDKSIFKTKEPFIICANHTSFYDSPLLIGLFYKRRINTLAADVLFKDHKVRSYFLSASGCIPINREAADFKAVKECLMVLKYNHCLIVFPEGHIETKKEIEALKGGAVLLATLAKVNILPIFIQRRTKKVKKDVITIGNFIEIDKNKVYSLKDIDELTNKLYLELEELKKVN